MYVNTTGTFGVASAACWWSRVATAAVRGAHHVLAPELASWMLLVADDLAVLMTHGRIPEKVLMILTYPRVMGFPLSWKKLAGGENLLWVGYELILKNSSLGLSEPRGWYTRLLRDRAVQMQEFQEGLGRAGIVCGALDYDRPFLATVVCLCSKACIAECEATPPCTSWEPWSISRRRYFRGVAVHVGCNVGAGKRFRWWTHMRTRTGWEWVTGGKRVGLSWFAVRITPENSPWASQRKGKAYRVIATLEALGLLLALLAFGPREHVSDTSLTVQVPALLTTKEMATQSVS